MEYSVIELLILAAVAAMAIILWFNQRGNGTVTIEGVADAIDVGADIWADAQGYVAAAEQLYLTGRLDKDSRFHYVLDRLKRDYPDLNTDQVINALEAGVFWLKEITDRKAA